MEGSVLITEDCLSSHYLRSYLSKKKWASLQNAQCIPLKAARALEIKSQMFALQHETNFDARHHLFLC